MRVRSRPLVFCAALAAGGFAGLWLGAQERRRGELDCRGRLPPEATVSLEGVALGDLPPGVSGRVALRDVRLVASVRGESHRCALSGPLVVWVEGPIASGSRVSGVGQWRANRFLRP